MTDKVCGLHDDLQPVLPADFQQITFNYCNGLRNSFIHEVTLFFVIIFVMTITTVLQ